MEKNKSKLKYRLDKLVKLQQQEKRLQRQHNRTGQQLSKVNQERAKTVVEIRQLVGVV